MMSPTVPFSRLARTSSVSRACWKPRRFGQLGQSVRDDLVLQPAVQAGALERLPGSGAEVVGELSRVVREVGAARSQEEESCLCGHVAERDLELALGGIRPAGAGELASVGENAPAGGARRLDDALDDDRQELEPVGRGGQSLAEARQRVPRAAPLLHELELPLLELGGHGVEGGSEPRELVAAANRDAGGEVLVRDRPDRVGELGQRAHDSSPEEVRDQGDDRESEDREEDHSAAQVSCSRVDLRLRDEHGQVDALRLGERSTRAAVLASGQVDILGLETEARETCAGLRARDDRPVARQDEQVIRLEPRPQPKVLKQSGVERHEHTDSAERIAPRCPRRAQSGSPPGRSAAHPLQPRLGRSRPRLAHPRRAAGARPGRDRGACVGSRSPERASGPTPMRLRAGLRTRRRRRARAVFSRVSARDVSFSAATAL